MHALVTVDFDDDTSLVVETCKELTSHKESQLTILGVAPDLKSMGLFGSTAHSAQEAQKDLLADVRTRAEDVCVRVAGDHEVHLASGKVADEIIKAAVLHNVDCVIKAQDLDADGAVMAAGQVAKALIRKCPVPVWISSPKSNHPPRTICVAVDNVEKAANRSEATLLTLNLIRHAVTLAKRLGIADVTLLHAWSAAGLAFLDRPRARVAPADIERYMEECEASARRAVNEITGLAEAQFAGSRVSFEPELVMGLPHLAIAQATRDLKTDILVIGSANRTGIMGLLVGNTAEAIINELDCSVYVVKPEELSTLIAAQMSGAEG